ncbi:TniB family NTP-binding protein [uncultured Aquitalea sp.]|uniref:TniB family NTP-binding protein n=1 Tax=uncultured Aquitalea sp. TaxID=540272 RepID=UPI0025FAE930|nr:TniB family NTP-binding protein [uncultured Aquitalea sp.]
MDAKYLATQLRQIEEILLPYRRFTRIVELLEYNHSLYLQGAEPRHTLLVGDAGAGKTWIAKHLLNKYPPFEEGGAKIIPILFVETPSTPTIKSMAEQILHALGDPLSYKGSAELKSVRALELLKRCKVEMIVFDEFQHFLDHGWYNSLQAVADWLKSFIDKAEVPCVLMGLPRCEVILQVNEQLRRRFSTRVELSRFSMETADEEREYRSVLMALDKRLPTEMLSDLASPDLAIRLYYASNGLIGYLRKLLTRSFELMVRENRSNIGIELLATSFQEHIWRDGIGSLNPFHPEFAMRPLTGPGEPFSYQAPTLRRTQKGGRK